MKSFQKNKNQKYRQLLIVLIFTFVVSPFLQAGIGNICLISLLLYTIMLIISSFPLPRKLLTIYGAIAIIAFSLEVVSSLNGGFYLNQTFSLISQWVKCIPLS